MIKLIESLLNEYVATYLALVVLVQVVIALVFRSRRARVRKRRLRQGLDDTVLLDQTVKLSELRNEAFTPALALVLSIFLGPVVIVGLATLFGEHPSPEEREGIVIVLLGFVIWLLFTGTDVAKAFLGGLAFKTLVAVRHPIQVGDKVTLRGHTGKLTDIGIFFVTLRKGGTELVSIPTTKLWSEVLVSANAGGRFSRCVMEFYLSPDVTAAERQAAEDALWDAIQASPYLEPSKPVEVLIAQQKHDIILTAKAFVASTHNDSTFKSDVTRAFLDRSADEEIPLA